MSFLIVSCERSQQDASPQIIRETNRIFSTLAGMELSAQPEVATWRGLQTDVTSDRTNALLGDRSQAAYERLRLRRIEALKILEGMELAPEGSRIRRHQEAVIRAYSATVAIAEFGHGRVALGVAFPYVNDHRTGAWIELPFLIADRQIVSDRIEAADYISRMVSLADVVQDERLRLLADARSGYSPPRFILDRMVLQLDAQLSIPPLESELLRRLDAQLVNMTGASPQVRAQLMEEADLAYRMRLRPALADLRNSVAEMAGTATDVAGVWALPMGDAYYDAVLALYVRQGLSAESMHRQGRNTVTAALARLDSALNAAGYETGTVAERLQELAGLPEQTFDDTPEGRRQLISEVSVLMAEQSRQLTAWVDNDPELGVVAVAMSADSAAAGRRAIYTPPTPDRQRPGIVAISLNPANQWPRYSLPALMLHESVPGHHTEASITMAFGQLPLIRQLIDHAGYREGWATYAENLALESGIYDADPLAEIGVLESQLFSAARMVVDTGIHRMRWERSEAIEYLETTVGLSPERAANEVDRIVVWPGHAVAYVAGAQQISDLRARAAAVVGEGFDLSAFHTALLSGGPRPLTQVEADMERWYETQMAPN